MKVAKWGNSLAIRLPAAVVEELDLTVGDEVEILASGKRTKAAAPARRLIKIKKAKTRRELLVQLREYRGMIPADFKFDREEANKRG